jgi:hypothetical protein
MEVFMGSTDDINSVINELSMKYNALEFVVMKFIVEFGPRLGALEYKTRIGLYDCEDDYEDEDEDDPDLTFEDLVKMFASGVSGCDDMWDKYLQKIKLAICAETSSGDFNVESIASAVMESFFGKKAH